MNPTNSFGTPPNHLGAPTNYKDFYSHSIELARQHDSSKTEEDIRNLCIQLSKEFGENTFRSIAPQLHSLGQELKHIEHYRKLNQVLGG